MPAPMNLRQIQPQADIPEDAIVDLEDVDGRIDPDKNLIVIDFPDGSVTINSGPLLPNRDASEHDENLANHLDVGELSSLSSELIRLIDDDLLRQEQRLIDIEKAIDVLGIKLEEPRSEATEEGMSVVKHPLLLEAILRFQANSRGEMLPADGPVKIRNDGGATEQLDEMANALEQDFNSYLTDGAPEYYPDTDRMFFSLGHGGEAYKKVYWHPIKRRPVSETIDRKDLILSDGAVSLEACSRVTHRSKQKPSDVKRMQLAGVWRDVTLGQAALSETNHVDEKLAQIAGVAPKNMADVAQLDRVIYECYCELDLTGFEHKEKGEKTGLALPYRVTIDKDSREVLEIRRWWEEDDEAYIRKEVFIEYVFVPAFPGLNLGLLHILGNGSRALTAAWRIALDNGMLANFPGGLMDRSVGKQQTTSIRVGPGQAAPMDAGGKPIKDAFMPLPYRDVTPGFVSIVDKIEQTCQRVGGTAETNVGEGRSDAPVGTTIALIEQATKVLNAVHKRMHTAQSKEFALLKELFRQEPEALWRRNRKPNLPKDRDIVVQALNAYDIVPKADPNTASQTLRIQKAIALSMRADAHPERYDGLAVERYLLGVIDIEDADELLTKETAPPAPQVDPAKMLSANAQMVAAQAKQAETAAKVQQGAFAPKAGSNPAELQMKQEELKIRGMDAATDAENRAKDREAKLAMENMKNQREAMIHASQLQHERQMQDKQQSHDQMTQQRDMMHEQSVQQKDILHDRLTQQAQQEHDRVATQSDLAHQLALKHADLAHQRVVHEDTQSLEADRMKQDAEIAKKQAAAKAKQSKPNPKK